MTKCHLIKQENDATALTEFLENFENEYDWTISFKNASNELFDKKKVANLFNVNIILFQKFGLISEITVINEDIE